MIAWREAVQLAVTAVGRAEELVEQGRDHLAQTYAMISYAWSNISMMLEAQEAAEAEVDNDATT